MSDDAYVPKSGTRMAMVRGSYAVQTPDGAVTCHSWSIGETIAAAEKAFQAQHPSVDSVTFETLADPDFREHHPAENGYSARERNRLRTYGISIRGFGTRYF